MGENKIYVDVTAKFTKDGRLYPVSFIWEDGSEYEIQKVTDIRRSASLRAGGVGLRYTCMINGLTSHIYYEDNNQWFVESK